MKTVEPIISEKYSIDNFVVSHKNKKAYHRQIPLIHFASGTDICTELQKNNGLQ